MQYAMGYGPVRLRTAIIPVTQFGSKFAFIALMLGLALYSQPMFGLGIILFGATTLFQLVPLPVEFNASARAVAKIGQYGLLGTEETKGCKKVLTAAAMTYVAAASSAILQLLRLVILFGGNNRRDD